MHIHANQFDPNLQLSAQYAAERAAARKEAAEVRDKLFKLAASVAAESEAVEDSATAPGAKRQRQGQGRQPYARSAGELPDGAGAPQDAEEASSGFST